MDKDRQQAKEYIKTLSFSNKAKHYLYYYKLHIIITAAILLLAGLYVFQRATATEYDLSVSVFSQELLSIEAEENAEKLVSSWVSGKNEELLAEINVVTVPQSTNENFEKLGAVYTKLDGQLAAGTIQALIVEEVVYKEIMSAPEYVSIMLAEYSCEIGENAKKKLGLDKKRKYYYLTRGIYQNEQGDEKAEAKHKNAIKLFEKIKKMK